MSSSEQAKKIASELAHATGTRIAADDPIVGLVIDIRRHHVATHKAIVTNQTEMINQLSLIAENVKGGGAFQSVALFICAACSVACLAILIYKFI